MALATTIRERLSGLFKRKGQLAELTGEDRQDFLREAANMGETRLTEYERCANYYDGDHPTRLLERARLFLQTSGLRYTENFCESIVDSTAERLRIEGFVVEENEDASDWLTKDVWTKNGMGEKEGVIHTQTLIKGDGFVIVTFDEERGIPKFTWNRPEIIKPVYSDDDPDEMLYASKVWTTNQRTPTNPDGQTIYRLNIYFPDRVEKWFTIGQKSGRDFWAPHLDPEDIDESGNAVWPVPWTMTGKPEDEPIGINVIHFRNKPKGRTFGRSELRNVIPQQDALTKQLLDLFYVMDAQGWKQRWASGIPDDAALSVAIGEWVKAENADAKFGEFSAEDPTKMVEAVEATLRRMAARSKTPMHLMMAGGNLPSGETLKTAESPLDRKCDDRKTTLSEPHERMQRLGIKVVDVFGHLPVSFDPEAEITTLWANCQSRNEQAETNSKAVQVEILGLSKATALRELGYDPEEEATNRAQEEEEAPAEVAPPPPHEPVVREPAAPSLPAREE